MKKNVLITGTSTGLGLETALLFARNGYRVFATMRNLDKSNLIKKHIEAENLDIELLLLDVSSAQSVNHCVTQIINRAGTIDILINNAGGGFAKTTEQATEEEMKWVTDLNYFGVVRCTKAVLPHMRKQKSGHIINLSSIGGLVGQPFNELYCGAKFAVEGYTEALSSYLTVDFGIKFTIVEPGGIATDFIKSAMDKTVENGQMAHPDYMDIFTRYMTKAQKRASEGKEKSYQTPIEVAQVILSVVQAEKAPLRVRTSEWAEDFCKLKTQNDPDGTILLNRVIERFL
ncbi:SDR family oxidoreductase [Riemerella anatipestifer]|nr:SDR family oxidoreductase [Riemerella anatipestifer]